jgi:pteridine reductase
MELQGKTALVTGGAKRVGRVIALKLAQKGVNILLHYNTSIAEAELTAKEIKSLGVQCEIFKADLGKPAEISKMLSKIASSGQTVDILINSASLFYKTPVGSVRESDWDTLIDVNLKAPFLLSLEIGKKMSADRGGKIINIADWSGFRPYRDYLPYCTSKGGLITMTKALARDLAPNVCANAIAPGPVLLPPDFTEEEKEAVTRKTVLGRVGSPDDIAHAVIFLCESDFINGITLTVDGGRSIN